MTALVVDHHEALTLEISETKNGEEDAGKARAYLIDAAPPGLDVWRVKLTRLDTREEHVVALDPLNRWRCSCKDRRWRPGRRPGCKHIRHVQPLYRLALSLVPVTIPEGST